MTESSLNKNNQHCYLCGGNDIINRLGSVRDNANISVLECKECGLVFLSSFDHIGINHYEESGMHDGRCVDIKKWLNDSKDDDARRYAYLKKTISNNTLLDFGCGPGGFLKLAKKISKKVFGVEVEKELHSSYEKINIKVFHSLQDAKNSGLKWKVITMFHVLEHMPDPIGVLKSLSFLLSNKGEIIIEVPNSNDALLSIFNNKEFQNFTYWSNHLYTFNSNTLKKITRKSGLKINWIKHIQRYPLSNHLYWLSHGKPGGHNLSNLFNNTKLNKIYEAELAKIKATDTIMLSVSKPN